MLSGVTMKKIPLFILILIFSYINAIEYKRGSGEQPATGLNLDRSVIYYHNNSDDYHWYGTSNWGVRFDLSEYLSADSQFEVDSVLVFIPNDLENDSLGISIYDDNMEQPDQLLGSNVLDDCQQGLNSIPLNNGEVILGDTLWVILSYDTNFSDKFVSASVGGGNYSYYESDGYFEQFNDNSIYSELLVWLKGDFIDNIDLELSSFEVTGEITTDSVIWPKFSVKNYAESSLTDIPLAIDVERAQTTTINDTIYFDIEPFEQVELDYSDDLEHQYGLTREHRQFKVTAEVLLESDVYQPNDIKTLEFNTFEKSQRKLFLEIFPEWDEGTNTDCTEMWNNLEDLIQNDAFFSDSVIVMNLFANITDEEFYRMDAAERFAYYELVGYPFTFVDGVNRINGVQNYPDLLQTYSQSSNLNDIVTFDSTSFVQTDYGTIKINFNFRNTNNYLFNEDVGGFGLYCAIMQDSITDVTGNIVIKYDQIANDFEINKGDSLVIEHEIELSELDPIYDIDLDSFLETSRCVYWIQNGEDKSIKSIGVSDYFDQFEIVALDEELDTSFETIDVFPNPFYPDIDSNLHFQIDNKVEEAKIGIYNIKGQKIISQQFNKNSNNIIKWDGLDSSGKKVSSGIYFIKISDKLKQVNQIKKILIIK